MLEYHARNYYLEAKIYTILLTFSIYFFILFLSLYFLFESVGFGLRRLFKTK